MRTVISILQKVLVNHFYKLNAGLFMFLFYMLFGLPQDIKAFHVSIATLIITNQTALLLTLLAWLLYNLKCIDYTIKRMKEPQQLFLSSLEYISFFKRFACLSYVQFILFLPATAYAVFIILIAINNHAYISAAIILLFIITVIPATALLYQNALKQRENQNRIILPGLIRLPKPLFSIPLFYILQNRRQMLLITKFFSLFILYLFIKAFEPDHYDIRPLLMCFLLAAIANCTIVFEIKSFEDDYLLQYRNFSFSIFKRFIHVLLMYVVLLLPELIFVWKGYPLHFNMIDYWQVVTASVGLLSLLHACLFTGNMQMESFIKIVFGIAMGLFFIILYNTGIILGVLLLIIAFALFHAYYYDFEKS